MLADFKLHQLYIESRNEIFVEFLFLKESERRTAGDDKFGDLTQKMHQLTPCDNEKANGEQTSNITLASWV